MEQPPTSRTTPQLRALARRVIWFQPSRDALADPKRFLCYLMARPTPEDIAIAARSFSRAEFLTALRNAPPGMFGPRAWAYLNRTLEGHTRRPRPQRISLKGRKPK